jgi:chemotaxis protein MotB
VDLFSNLVIILIFLLIVFVFLWTTTSVFNSETGVKRVAELTQQNADQAAQIATMNADDAEAKRILAIARNELEQLAADTAALKDQNAELDRILKSQLAILNAHNEELRGQVVEKDSELADLDSQLQNLSDSGDTMFAIIETLKQQLEFSRGKVMDSEQEKSELAAELQKLNDALNAAEARSAERETQYAALSQRLNKALADRAAAATDVNQYQSDFYTAIKTALSDRTTVDTSSDRFVIPSDILFASGKYELSDAGKKQLRIIAGVIKDLENQIPVSVNWIIRVDGHTDKKKVISGTTAYKNNTELSLLRARAVARELIGAGVSRQRVIPSGFGELYPRELGTDAASLQKNRRIELRLTNP